MQTEKLNSINRIPSLTWNWLKMNRANAEISIPENIKPLAKIEGRSDGIKIFRDSEEKCSEIPYIEKSLPEMQTISSEDYTKILDSTKCVNFAIISEKQSDEPAILNFNLDNNSSYIGKQTVIAEENSSLTLILNYTSLPFANGIFGIQTKLWAKANSKIHLVKVQLLGQKIQYFDDTQSFAEDGASIEVTQIQLGSKESFSNVTSILNGYKSSFKSQTACIAKDEQFFDMNYATIHKGHKTDTKMKFVGVLLDNAKKVYRGTIDFKNGCKGATGDEQEETLLLSKTAVNKSIPVILCDEEEVSGTHGATLGRLGANELFYFESRGISEKQAEKIMTRAKVLSVAQKISDEKTLNKIKEFLGEEKDE